MNEQKTWESGVQRFRKGSPHLRKRGTKGTLGELRAWRPWIVLGSLHKL